MKSIDGGVTAPKGYRASGIAAGIKKRNKDMALLTSDSDAAVAGLFTTNVVKAAPVVWDQHIVSSGLPVRALLINSGNANACTGKQGFADTSSSAALVAEKLGITDKQVLVCSTGVIGVPMPMDRIAYGIPLAFDALSYGKEAAHDAAQAICTTDTFVKEVAVEIQAGDASIRIGGMAKGSGMIHPNMATMLSFITTDASVDASYLQTLLRQSTADSYHMISVDRDTSTNDTVLVFANGASGASPIVPGSAVEQSFIEALGYVHTKLAKMIARDGEGATKLIEVTVTGAVTKDDARLMARSVVSSNLVKAAFFGSDANWGRIICAMGYSGARFDPEGVSIGYRSIQGAAQVLDHGSPVPFDEQAAKRILQEKEIFVDISTGDGPGVATAWGCDLTYDYVRINGDYRS